jgi:FolB domain-containing protein
MNTYKLSIQGLREAIHLGWEDAERAHPQVVTIDLILVVANQTVGTADDLAQTVDYAAVTQTIKDALRARRWKIVEYLLAVIGDLLLETYPLIVSVTISLRKTVLAEIDGFVVTTTRLRDNEGSK